MSSALLVRPEESRSRYDFQGVIENECLELEWIQRILEDDGYNVTVFDKQVESMSFQEFISGKTLTSFMENAGAFRKVFCWNMSELLNRDSTH